MKIQIMNIYKESFSNVLSHKWEWAKIFSGPLLLWSLGFAWLAVAFLSNLDSFSLEGIVNTSKKESFDLLISQFCYQIITMVAELILIVGGVRYAVLQEGGDQWFSFNFNVRMLRVFLYTLLLGILAAVYILISAVIALGAYALFTNWTLSIIFGIALFIGFIYLAVRILLYQVVISLDQKEPLKTSWALMNGNILRVIGLSIVIALTFSLIAFGVGAILAVLNGLLFWAGNMLGVLSLVLWIPFLVILTCAGWAVSLKSLSLIYQGLTDK